MASNNPTRGYNTSASAFTGLARPIAITPDAPGNVSYMLPSDSPYRSRRTVEVRPEGRTGPYTPNDNKMRIIFPTGKQCGYADMAATGKLHFDLLVEADATDTGCPVWALSKISAQGLIQRARLYQVENDIEDMRFYNYFQNYLVKPFVVPSDSIFAETQLTELDCSKYVALTWRVNQVAANDANYSGQLMPWNGSDNKMRVPVALTINLGFFSEPVLLPLPHLASPLILEIDFAPYHEAFLDYRLSKTQWALANQTNNSVDKEFFHLVGKETAYNKNIPTTSSEFFSSASTGTYTIDNVRFRYEEVYVDPDLDNRIKTRILSADGLIYHYETHIQDQATWGGSAADLNFALQCRSLKQAYALTFESGAQLDSYQIPQPWLPGFKSAQWEIATSLWPARPYTTTLEIFDALNSALGIQQSRMLNRLVGAPADLVGNYYDTNTSAQVYFSHGGHGGAHQFASPIHNQRMQNFVPYGYNGEIASSNPPNNTYSAPDGEGLSSVRAPDGFAWGVAHLVDGSATITLDGSNDGCPNPIRVTGETYSSVGSVVIAGIKGGSQGYAPASSGSIYIDEISASFDPEEPTYQTFKIKSTNADDNRYVYWAVMPRPTGQRRAAMQAGSSTVFTADTLDNVANKVIHFTNFLDGTYGYNFAVANINNLRSSRVLPLGNNDLPVNSPMIYATISQNTQPGLGPISFRTTIPSSAWQLTSGTSGLSMTARITLPAGVVLSQNSSIFIQPQGVPDIDEDANGSLSQQSADWQSFQEVYFDSDSQQLFLRLPRYALLAGGSTESVWGVTIFDLDLFPTSSSSLLTATTKNAITVKKIGYVKGMSPFEFGPGYKLSNTFVGSSYVKGVHWNKQWFVIGQNFEADRNPYAISGIDLFPNQTLQLHLTRHESAANPIQKFDIAAVDNPTDGGSDYWQFYLNGATDDVINAGGWPQLTTRVFFVHDRVAILRNGVFSRIIK